jgi:hypothetical protein
MCGWEGDGERYARERIYYPTTLIRIRGLESTRSIIEMKRCVYDNACARDDDDDGDELN